MRRDLTTIAGRAPGMGRALMYRTTKEFLRYFGLNFVTDLPRLEEFAEVLGLKPGELELAVEGAESVAEVTSGDAEIPPPPDQEMGEDMSVPHEPDGPGATNRPDDATGAPCLNDDPGFATHGNAHALEDRNLIVDIDET